VPSSCSSSSSRAASPPHLRRPAARPRWTTGRVPSVAPRRNKLGTGHVLTGVVLSSVDCRTLAGARVHLWQANRRGEYVRAGSATVVTDRAGRFRFEGPRPVSYEGRPPHIHLRVVATNHELLFARYVSRPGATRGFIRLVLIPQRL
jgi:protocatechuate 3,4-dioxygenase beta subunit